MRSIILKRAIGAFASLALAVGISAGAAPPAHGANVWDKVAQCESGGNWKINTGNGYYGGLQFAGGTWRAFGGRQYASMAHRATKAEQIAIARRVLAGQGPRAWPTCSRRANLTRSNGKADRKAVPSTNPTGSSPVEVWTKAERRFAQLDAQVRKPTKRRFVPGKTIRVRKGDDLIKIARRYDVSGGWKRVYVLNKRVFNLQVKQNKRLSIGQVVRIKR